MSNVVPHGLSVRSALSPSSEVAEICDQVCSVIDSVHSDGMLPVVEVSLGSEDSMSDFDALYVIDGATGASIGIKINPASENPQFSLLHEIGHFLDYEAIQSTVGYLEGDQKTAPTRRGFASASSEALAEWRREVQNSEAVKGLYRLYQHSSAIVSLSSGAEIVIDIDYAHVDYLVSFHEMFARSYVQYVTTRSAGGTMTRVLRTDFNKMRTRPLQSVYPEFWSDEDFVSIADVFEMLFKELEWA